MLLIISNNLTRIGDQLENIFLALDGKEEDDDEDSEVRHHIFPDIDSDHETILEDEDPYEIAILDAAVSFGAKIGFASYLNADDKVTGVIAWKDSNILKLTNPSDRFNTKSFIQRDHITIDSKRFVVHFEIDGHSYIAWNSKKELCLVDFLLFVYYKNFDTKLSSASEIIKRNR